MIEQTIARDLTLFRKAVGSKKVAHLIDEDVSFLLPAIAETIKNFNETENKEMILQALLLIEVNRQLYFQELPLEIYYSELDNREVKEATGSLLNHTSLFTEDSATSHLAFEEAAAAISRLFILLDIDQVNIDTYTQEMK